MKRRSILAASCAGLFLALAGPALADGPTVYITSDAHPAYGHGHVHPEGHGHDYVVAERVTITISCFRGPWQEVIWDRPEPVFVDSLVAAGYTFPEAHAIAERVCRDIDGVGNAAHAEQVMLRIIEDQPPHWNP